MGICSGYFSIIVINTTIRQLREERVYLDLGLQQARVGAGRAKAWHQQEESEGFHVERQVQSTENNLKMVQVFLLSKPCLP